MSRLSAIILAAMLFVAPAKLHAATPVTHGLKQMQSVVTPNTEFEGAVILHGDGKHRWVCVFPSGYAIMAEPWNTGGIGDYWETSTRYSLLQMHTDGTADILDRTTLPSPRNATPLRIEQSHRSNLRLTAQNGTLLFTMCPTGIPTMGVNDTIRVYSNGDVGHIDKFAPYPRRRTVATNDAMPDSISNHAGRWAYLDRVTPKDGSVQIGGRYVLDICDDPANPGNLLLVYVSGAGDDSPFWHPGDIKGVLVPSGFAGNYDLTWYDTRRRELDLGECSATFDGYDLLTLDFPLYGCQIRLKRLPSPR